MVSGQRAPRNVGMSWPKGVGSERAASLGRANGPAPRRVIPAAPKPKKAPVASALASGFLVSPYLGRRHVGLAKVPASSHVIVGFAQQLTVLNRGLPPACKWLNVVEFQPL